ncbi:MAG: FlgD immunoglobulin-like domain containing protein, partial [candidate division WOR-3 bacterium]
KAAYRLTKAKVEIVRESGPFAVLANTAKLYETDPPSRGNDNALASDQRLPELLLTAQPNPFRDGCLMSIRGLGSKVITASVYDAGGRLVRRLTDLTRLGDEQTFRWDGMDDLGVPVRNGTYYCRIADGVRASCLKLVKR